jgi:hypothetical protein
MDTPEHVDPPGRSQIADLLRLGGLAALRDFLLPLSEKEHGESLSSRWLQVASEYPGVQKLLSPYAAPEFFTLYLCKSDR